MLWQTHIAIGAITGALCAGKGGETFVAASLGAVGALLPDIDTPKSKLGNNTMLSKGISSVFGHRGAMHSLMGCFGILLILRWIVPKVFLIYIGLGYLSHLFADMLNPLGIPLLWPVKTRFKIPLVRTGGNIEKYIVLPMLLVILGRVFLPMLVAYI